MTQKLSSQTFKIAQGLEKLQNNKFFGKLTLMYQNGKLHRAKKEETFDTPDKMIEGM